MFLFQGLFCKMRTDWSTTVLPSASHCCWHLPLGCLLIFVHAGRGCFRSYLLLRLVHVSSVQTSSPYFAKICRLTICRSVNNVVLAQTFSLCKSLRPIPRVAASKTTSVRYQNGSCLSHFLNLYDLTKRSHE